MRGARGPFPPVAAMVVMAVVGSWLLGHDSTVGIVIIIYGINLIFSLNDFFGVKFRQHADMPSKILANLCYFKVKPD